MKRISLFVLAAAFALTAIGYVYSEPPSRVAPRIGKVLVKKLPAKVEGVELTGNAVRLKTGYKFVKRGDGSVTVARMAGGGGGLGLGGTWTCSCSKGGSCTISSNGGILKCSAGGGTCKGSCELVVTTSELTARVMMY